MAYKFSKGSRELGDIEYENDTDTQIDFEDDFVALKTAGNQVLVISGSQVGVGISAPTQNLHVVGSGNTTLRVQGPDGYYGALNVKGGTGDSAWLWQPANTSDLRFFTVDDDRMIILGSGEIGVGTMAPKGALDVHHNPTGLSNNTGGGEVVTFGTGTLTAGKIYYLNSSGAWTETDADAVATSDGLVGIALGTGASDGVLLRGFFDATTYLSNFVAGSPVYLSATAASMDTTQPAGAGDVVRCVGYCTNTANVIYFNPSSTTIELS
ncbi:MAG TPA: hypothetical protein EYN27_04520 [Rhodospirillales bacterium]|nr:hypothetical protein [Phycisphaerales bacterium]HIO38194.1 hypothetical protein [Rhodospirillales bacterium]